jgi:spermidine/putrescine transport system substrate-binding protein
MRAAAPPPDMIVPPDYAVRELSVEGRLLTLDHERLPNLQHLDPRFRTGRAHDPESRVSVIKDWGTTGFMYRLDVVTTHLPPKRSGAGPVVQSWAGFWALAEKYSGQVTVLNSPGEVIGAALKMRGRSYNAADAESLAQAREDLLWLKPHVRAFETDYKPLLTSGEVCLSLGWNGDAAALNAAGVRVKYVVPGEGSQIWEDDWAIAAGAPHPEAAHTFLNFVLRPEVAAQEARYTRYATGNRAALAMLDDDIRDDPSTYLPLDAEGNRRREELWREVRGA